VRLQQRQELRLFLGMKISRALLAPRADFWEEVRRIEESLLFSKLAGHQGKGRKAIRIVPRRCGYFMENFNRPARNVSDVETLLEGHERIIERMRALGEDQFAAIFLCDDPVGIEEQAEAAGLTCEEVRFFHDQILDKVFIADAFEHAAAQPPAEARARERIGRFVIEEGILRFDPFLERRRYEIDESALAELMRSGELTRLEVQEGRQLLRTLSFVNLRLNLFHQVAGLIAARQERYLMSGSENDLAILEERDASEILGVHPSWLCRLLQGKSVLTPWGERDLRVFFVTGKSLERKRGKSALGEILVGAQRKLSDAELSRLLIERTGIKAARRTVNVWRRELEARPLSRSRRGPSSAG
jgi:hypothetical protein